MCHISTPLLRLAIKPTRLDLVGRKMAELRGKVSNANVYEVANELGWTEAVDLTENGVTFNLSPLQKVALCAAVIAAAEAGFEMEDNPDFDHTVEPEEYVDVDA